MAAAVDPSEVKVIELSPLPRPHRTRRNTWWGLIGLLSGFIAAAVFAPQGISGIYYNSFHSHALLKIHGACMGAAIGFTIELVSVRTWPTIPSQFRLRTLLAICYIIAVIIITMRNYLILKSL